MCKSSLVSKQDEVYLQYHQQENIHGRNIGEWEILVTHPKEILQKSIKILPNLQNSIGLLIKTAIRGG